jgi:phosphate:Na+ symporter
MLELFAILLVGLSFFFIGVDGIKSNLQVLTTRRFRRMLAQWASRPLYSPLAGFISGALTQSSTAVAFILVSLISSGSLTLRQSLPVVAWSNLGVTLLVFLAAIRLDLAILYMLGLSGLALVFFGKGKLKVGLSVLYAVGLLFYGLALMKQSFAPLPAFPWFNDVAAFFQQATFTTFFLGLFLRIIIQSSSGISVIAITLAASGLFTETQALLMMFGTGAGVGVSIWLLSSDLRGLPRQITLFQGIINTAASLVALLLTALAHLLGLPLPQILDSLPGDISFHLSLSFLCLQTLCVVISLLIGRKASAWLERISPTTGEEDLAAPRYLVDQWSGDAESALELAEKEQVRLIEIMPLALAQFREETGYTSSIAPSVVSHAVLKITGEVKAFLGELLDQKTDRQTAEDLLRVEQRNSTIQALGETLKSFAQCLEEQPQLARDVPLVARLTEGVNTLLLSALDAVRSADSFDVELLSAMTSDRSEMMEKIRQTQLNKAGEPHAAQVQSSIFYLTTLFERFVWLLHQLALSLRQRSNEAK